MDAQLKEDALSEYYVKHPRFGRFIQFLKAHKATRRLGISIESFVITVLVGAILFGVAVGIVAPQLNSLTTGATPIVSPTSTTGTLIGDVVLFFALGFILAILAGAIAVYRHPS
jgi:hypothetical protein